MRLATTFAAAAMLLGAAGAAQAAPVAPSAGVALDAPIVHVMQGCGFGAHRGPYGGCRLNNGPRGAMRAMMGRAPRGCPPGMGRNRFGRCRPF